MFFTLAYANLALKAGRDTEPKSSKIDMSGIDTRRESNDHLDPVTAKCYPRSYGFVNNDASNATKEYVSVFSTCRSLVDGKVTLLVYCLTLICLLYCFICDVCMVLKAIDRIFFSADFSKKRQCDK